MTIAVLATDGSPNSLAAARRLLRPGLFVAPLTVLLVHVSPEITGRPKAYFTPGVLEEWLEEAAAQAFEAILPVLSAEGITVVEHRCIGEPAAEIVRLAKEAKADAIVMGTHGRGAFVAAVMGSIASRVVSSATVPVLLVPDTVDADSDAG